MKISLMGTLHKTKMDAVMVMERKNKITKKDTYCIVEFPGSGYLVISKQQLEQLR